MKLGNSRVLEGAREDSLSTTRRAMVTMATGATRPELEELLTLGEVAKIFKVEEGTVRKWRSNREGPKGFRVGKYVRYRRSAVADFIAEREAEEAEKY